MKYGLILAAISIFLTACEPKNVEVKSYYEPSEEAPVISTLIGSRYIHTKLLVATDQNRKCQIADWACMDRVCKSELGASSWRGEAGCWQDQSRSSYICYWDCFQYRVVE